jgi:hypothetical protein
VVSLPPNRQRFYRDFSPPADARFSSFPDRCR